MDYLAVGSWVRPCGNCPHRTGAPQDRNQSTAALRSGFGTHYGCVYAMGGSKLKEEVSDKRLTGP